MEQLNQITMVIVGIFILVIIGLALRRHFSSALGLGSTNDKLGEPPSAINMEFIAKGIEKLAEMRKDGKMTDEEFEAAKAKLLASANRLS